MLDKNKLTKYIWYDNIKWELVEVISPSKYDDFLLLKIIREDIIHPDDVPVVDMTLIDAHDDEFYPNTKLVQKAMKQYLKYKEKVNKETKNIAKTLGRSWLDIFKER